MPISALAYISYLLYPNYQCAKHTAVIYALKEMFSSHQDLTLEVGGIRTHDPPVLKRDTLTNAAILL